MSDLKSQDSLEDLLAALATRDVVMDGYASEIAAIDADIHSLEQDKSSCFRKRNPLEQQSSDLRNRLANDLLTHEGRAELEQKRSEIQAEMEERNKEISAIGAQIEVLKKKRAGVQSKLTAEASRLKRPRQTIVARIEGRLKERADHIGYVKKAMVDYLEGTQAADISETLKPAIGAAGDISLHSAGRASGANLQISIRSSELENRIQAILDQLTDRRIAEEMDTTTYLFRLETAFKRARDRAAHLKSKVFERFDARIEDTVEQISADEEALAKEIDGLPERHFATEKPKWKRQNAADAATIHQKLEQLSAASKALRERLRVFVEDICADGKFDDAKNVGRSVSRHIERGTSVRFWPLIVAFVTAVVAKLAINLGGSTYLAINAFSIVLTTFAGAYAVSLFLGMRQRKAVMDAVQGAYKTAVDRLFALDSTSEDFRFQKLDIGRLTRNQGEAPSLGQTLDFDGKKIQRRANRLMYAWNTVMTAAVFAVLTIPTGVFQRLNNGQPIAPMMALHGQNPDGSKCILAKGHITGENQNAYLMLSAEQRAAGLGSWLLPELYASSYAKPAVQAVRDATEAGDLERCDTFMASAPLQIQQFSLDAPKLQVTMPQVNTPDMCANPDNCPWNSTALDDRLVAFDARLDTLLKAQASILDLQNILVEVVSRDAGKVTTEEFGETLKTIAAMLQDLKDRPQVTPLVVDYNIHEVPDSFSAKPSKIFWNFSLVVNDKEIFRDDNALLIKFFPANVSGTQNKDELAYEVGRNSLKQDMADDLYAAASRYYLDQLVQQILKRLNASDAPLTLEIAGFASDPWETETDPEKIGQLNHALAEGRRAAVLDYLVAALADEPNTRDRISRLNIIFDPKGAGNPRPCLPLETMSENLAWQKKDYHAFQLPQQMISARNSLFEEKQISPKARYADFIGRSTLVRVAEGGCL